MSSRESYSLVVGNSDFYLHLSQKYFFHKQNIAYILRSRISYVKSIDMYDSLIVFSYSNIRQPLGALGHL